MEGVVLIMVVEMDPLDEILSQFPGWEVSSDGAVWTAPDGCLIEPDGRCPHGTESPLLQLGFI